MSPDDLQQAWQAHSSNTRVTVDTDLLLTMVRRSEQEFRMMIFWRDCREIGVALVLLPVWFYLGITVSPPWTWYLSVPSLIWVIAFLLFDRKRHGRRQDERDESLLACGKASLRQVEHQIWLLRSVLWWYLLPFAVPILIFFVHVSWLTSRSGWQALASGSMMTGFTLAIFGFIYFINQYAVRKQLEPRRQELLALLAMLSEDPANDVRSEYPILSGNKRSTRARRWIILGTFVVFGIIAVDIALNVAGTHEKYPRTSPFSAVRWQEQAPEVQVNGEWFRLTSLNDIPAADIVAFSQKSYGAKWRKRFEEDLVELLTNMGHPPHDTVKLVLQSLTSPATRTLDAVSMTRENRDAIRNAAQARATLEGPSAALEDLVLRLREEKKLVGLAAMVMVDGKVVASAVNGERKRGSGVELTIDDVWHLGSISKSVTATMIARLVESGKMQWSDSIATYFPEDTVHKDWRPVTLQELLTHTAGAPANFPNSVARQYPPLGPESTRARREAVLGVLGQKPETTPGTTFAYSNVGFTIAGAMAEKATGETWDALVQREVYDALDLKGAGFGPPKSSDKNLEQPRGHHGLLGWKIAASDTDDNTSIIAPAGWVHMTLQDLCTYANEHLRGELGRGTLLSTDTYKLLHTPNRDRYARGWVKNEPGAEIPHTVYWHNGSNTMWYALVVFIPDKNMVVAVTANDGDVPSAQSSAWEIVASSARQVGVEAGPAPSPPGR